MSQARPFYYPYILPVFFGILFLSCRAAFAQKINARFQYFIHRTTLPIRIDGNPDDSAWKMAQVATDFFMVLPMDTSLARVRTVVKMTYDSKNLYLLAICYNRLPGPYMVESLRRDFNFQKNDNFLVFIDPFNDLTDGYSFGANAAGAQWDGTMYNGGAVDLNWDNKWVSAVKNYPYGYVLEMAIPFKTLRYKKGSRVWGINFSRNDLKTAEKSSWAPVPRQFPTASLAYTGNLVWDHAPPDPGLNISLIPYLLGGVARDYENGQPTAWKQEAGLDGKLALSSSMNLDLTLNPDFSEVEVDQQVTNLSRYELFFPEKRQFFLENADLFGGFGYADLNPFFSRRIGLLAPIRYGARLSGKLGRNWRLGVMDMQTGTQDSLGLPAQNYSVVALQRRVFARSTLGAFFINKVSEHYLAGQYPDKPDYSPYNRTAGLEYDLASRGNRFTGKSFLMKTFTPGLPGKDWAQAANLEYLGRHWMSNLEEEYVGRNFNAEVGYIPRTGFFRLYPTLLRNFFPKGGPVLSHGPQWSASYYFDTGMHLSDYESTLSYLVTFRDKSLLTATYLRDYVRLLQPFDPTNSGKDSLGTGSINRWGTWGLEYDSKPSSLFTYTVITRIGGYYDRGSLGNLNIQAGYRFQPYASLSLNMDYTKLNLPAPWGVTNLWLVGPRVDITFTNNFYFTTFIQYNNQLKNLNINSRLQWRYKPASDLFLAYTDNYFPFPFRVRNRTLILKWTYWWSL